MKNASQVKPALLGKMNERQVFQVIQKHGSASRADVTRYTGISAPTVSKAVASLLDSGLLEESEAPVPLRGRPAKRLQLASRWSQVLVLVIDHQQCSIAAAGLDGRIHDEHEHVFPTPGSYRELLDAVVEQAQVYIRRRRLRTLGMGISLPGLVDYHLQQSLLSPNLPLTNGRTVGFDLRERLKIECVILQETHALCLAERMYGDAQGLDDFGILDVGTGIGMGVMSGGRLHRGASGLAGEIGHLTVEPEGRLCGCGNRGCLETVSSLSALAKTISEAAGRQMTNEQAVEYVLENRLDLKESLEKMNLYLGIGIGGFINLFNPSTLFIHSPLHAADQRLFARLIERVSRHALEPNFARCRITPARGTKRQGALAGIIEHMTNALAPALMPSGFHPDRSRHVTARV